jgi:hypothetical protein
MHIFVLYTTHVFEWLERSISRDFVVFSLLLVDGCLTHLFFSGIFISYFINLGEYGNGSITTKAKTNCGESIRLVSDYYVVLLDKKYLGVMINTRQRPTLIQAARATSAFTTGFSLPNGYTYVHF